MQPAISSVPDSNVNLLFSVISMATVYPSKRMEARRHSCLTPFLMPQFVSFHNTGLIADGKTADYLKILVDGTSCSRALLLLPSTSHVLNFTIHTRSNSTLPRQTLWWVKASLNLIHSNRSHATQWNRWFCRNLFTLSSHVHSTPSFFLYLQICQCVIFCDQPLPVYRIIGLTMLSVSLNLMKTACKVEYRLYDVSVEPASLKDGMTIMKIGLPLQSKSFLWPF